MSPPKPREGNPASVRVAAPGDAETLAALHVSTWQEAYAGLMPDDYLRSLTSAQRLPIWQGILSAPERVVVYVAESGVGPIGFSCGGVSNDEDADPGAGELWSIYLRREFWGRGVGRSLHDVMIEELARRGFANLTLWVMESNERTRRWYERQGWSADGSRKIFEVGGTPIGEVRYRRPLASA